MQKIVYVGFAFNHHAKTYAGYHQIKSYISYDHYIDCQKEKNFVDKVIKRKWLIDRIYIKVFGPRLWRSELKCIFYSLFHKHITFHIIYGENILKYLYLFRKQNHIVSTFHLPYELISKNKDYCNAIKHSQKVIILTQKDLLQIKKIKGDENVFYIPHGISTSFYKPGEIKRNPKHLLMVGNMLRNFQLANTIFNKLLDRDNTLSITIVTQLYNHHYFTKRDRLILLHDISNKSLLNLYQTVSLLILPMYSFTANNALLEALSCGCHVHIISDRIDNSYQTNNVITHTSAKNIQESIDFIENYIENFKDDSYSVRESIIKKYSWEVIADQVYKLLQQ